MALSVRTVVAIALICLALCSVNVDARLRSLLKPKKPKLVPILECVSINTAQRTYTAYIGFENQEGNPVNVTVDTDDNRIYGFGINFNSRCPRFFPLWRIVPGRPGRSPPFPNVAFTLTLPLYSIGFWGLCGRILIITQWGPRCDTPDVLPPVFKTPNKCPYTYPNLPAKKGTVNAEWSTCFEATDTDREGGITYDNTFDDEGDGRCVDEVDLNGLGPHTGSVSAADRSGNTATCAITINVIDTQPPVLTCPVNLQAFITNVNDETLSITSGVTVTATDNNPAAVITYKWYVKDGSNKQFLPSANTQGTGATAVGPYRFGENKVYFVAEDSGTPGVTGTSKNKDDCSFKVTVGDRAKPKFITCPAPIVLDDARPSPKRSVIAKATDTLTRVTLSSTRTYGGVTTPGSSEKAECKNTVQLDGSLDKNEKQQPFLVGVTTIVFTATDASGNTETCTTTVTVRPVNPTFTTCPVSLAANTIFNLQYGTISPIVAVPPSGFTVRSTITPPSRDATVLDVAGLSSQNPVDGSYTAGANVAGRYPVGATTVTFTTVEDPSIKCGSVTFTVTDVQAPTIECPALGTLSAGGVREIALNTDNGSPTASVPPTLFARGFDNYRLRLTNTFTGSTEQVAQAVGLTQASATSTLGATTLAVGTYNIQFRASDGVATRDAVCNVRVIVADREVPTISCPANVAVTLASGASTVTIVDDVTPRASDNTIVVTVTGGRNGGSSAAGTYSGAQHPATSVTYSYNFVATDQYGNTASCPQPFTITVNTPAYCPAGTCGQSAPCSVTTTTGVATGYSCDCRNTFCYATQRDCKSASFPFPTLPSTQRDSNSACTDYKLVAESSSCLAQSIGQNVGVTRSYSLFSVVPLRDTLALENILRGADDLNEVTFPADVLDPGTVYTIRVRYTVGGVGGASVFYNFELTQLNDQAPTATILGPVPSGGSFALIAPAPTSIMLYGSAYTCGELTSDPTYAWSQVGGPTTIALNPTNAANLIVSLTGITMNQEYRFRFTATDTAGNSASVEYTITFVPDPSGPGPCAGRNGPPEPAVVIMRGSSQGPPNAEQDVPFIFPGGLESCPVPPEGTEETGCQATSDVNGGNPTRRRMDARDSVDPRNCGLPADQQRPLSFKWEFFYPNEVRQGEKYFELEGLPPIIGGLTDSISIPQNYFPTLTGETQQYWRAVVTITSGHTPTMETKARFKFRYIDSTLQIEVVTNCEEVVQPGDSCDYQATLPPEFVDSANGFATTDASAWTWTWTANPPVDLTNYGQGTPRLRLPRELTAGVYYTFSVVATKGEMSATSSITTFVRSNLPSGGNVLVNPSAGGAALTQAFLLSAPGWSSRTPLQYAFKYIIGDVTEDSEEISLTSLSWSPTATVRLPAGRITVVVYIYNQEGGSTRTVIATPLTVTQPTTTNTACWVLNIVSTLLARAEQQQQTSVTLQLVSYLADYLKAPELQNVNALTCDGIDKTAELQALRQRFMTLLENIAKLPLDATESSMLASAMNRVVSNARVTQFTQQEAESTAATLSAVIGSMSSQGQTPGAMQQTQAQVLNMASQLIGWIDNCDVLDEIASNMRTMFSMASTRGMPGEYTVSMAADNFAYASKTVLANRAQSANLGDIVFNLPAVALASEGSDFAVNMINFIDSHVRQCRAKDVFGNPSTVGTDIFSIELMNTQTRTIQQVSGLSSPITFSLPIRTDLEVPSCGNGAGPLTCAWWDANTNGWSSAGCQTTSRSVTLPSGATGIQCSCSHLTEFAGVRGNTMCPDQSMIRGFRGVVAIYVVLFALVAGLFFRTVRQTSFSLRENMLFTAIGAILCAVRLALACHYAEFKKFPVGSVDVLAVVPYAILYWINGHYFKEVRIQRIESTEARVRWRVEPILNLVQVGVFFGMLTLLAGIGMDESSQMKMAIVVSRVVAIAYCVSNTIFFGYGATIMAGFASGRSDVPLTRAMAVVSFAALMESVFWVVYPTNGWALFPATICDLIAIGVLMFRYRNPTGDSKTLQSRTSIRGEFRMDGDEDASPVAINANDMSSPLSSNGPRSSQFVAMDSPRRPSTQLEAPPQVDAQA